MTDQPRPSAREVALAELQRLRAEAASIEQALDSAPPDPPVLTRAELEAMPPNEVNARWPEVRAAIAGTRPPGPLTTAELADLEHLDRDAINQNWPAVVAELERRKEANR